MDSACDELLASAGLPRNQNSGIRSSDFGSMGKNSLQRLRGANNFLEHRSPIHLVPQRQILSIQLVLELLDFLKRSFQLIFRTLAIGYVHRTTNELDEFSRWARDGMAHSVNPLESSVRKNNAELKVVIRFLTNCARDYCLPLVSILRMHALQPFFPPWHPSPRIKSVYALPFLGKMQRVSSCYLPDPTAHVRKPLRFCEMRFTALYLPIKLSQFGGCFIEDSP